MTRSLIAMPQKTINVTCLLTACEIYLTTGTMYFLYLRFIHLSGFYYFILSPSYYICSIYTFEVQFITELVLPEH